MSKNTYHLNLKILYCYKMLTMPEPSASCDLFAGGGASLEVDENVVSDEAKVDEIRYACVPR